METRMIDKFGAGEPAGPFQVFTATDEDRALVQQWIDADPDHRGMDAGFFVDPQPGAQCLILKNESGKVFYFRLSRVMRIDIQFPPIESAEEKETIRRSLSAGFKWLVKRARGAGFSQVIFNSHTRELKAFCRRFGFSDSPEELVASLTAPSPDLTDTKS